ncbi:AI-2E family transporter [Arthrobacter sp. JSM 101049]|uniref:AI-2E family transporter n=1 Tax=Arthrobacter sp. JSM 101049 TaxID=929097 RepID=UPI003561EBFC
MKTESNAAPDGNEPERRPSAPGHDGAASPGTPVSPAAPVPAEPPHDGQPVSAAQRPSGADGERPPAGAPSSFGARVRALLRRARPVPIAPAPEAPDDLDPIDTTPGVHHPIFTGFMISIGVGLALLLYFILTNVGSLLVWIAIALFIALGLEPIVRFLERHGLPRPLGVLAAILLLAAVFGGVVGTLVPTIVRQTTAFVEKAPDFVDSFLNSEFFTTIDDQFQVRERITEEVDKFFQNSDAVGGVFGGVIGVGSVVAQGMFGTLIVLVLAVYILASLPGLKAWCYRLAPRSKRERVQVLSEQITNSVGNYVMGQAVVALLNALYAFIVMSIVGVPYSLLLSMVVALLAFIPLVGAVIAGILVSLIALTVGWETAVVYAIFYFGYLQFEAYFISPRIMQRTVAVPGAVAVIAVIAGGALLGVVGALMAIPLAASAMLLIREVFMARQERL